jgi:hypothetical protein
MTTKYSAIISVFTNNELPFVLFLNLKHVELFHIKLLTHEVVGEKHQQRLKLVWCNYFY